LGGYPTISLADAREAAERIRAQVRAGSDPQQDKRDGREARSQALKFNALCDLYLEHAKRHKSSWKNDEGYLRANARPVWGDRAAAAITKPDVAKLLLDVVGRSPTTANRVRSIMVTMFTWAVDNALLETSPMVGVKKPAKEGQGKTRVLRDDELRVFWNALDDAGLTPSISAALRTILLLGQRPNEVAGMARDELVDFDSPNAALWSLPAGRMKGRRPRRRCLRSHDRLFGRIASREACDGEPNSCRRFADRERRRGTPSWRCARDCWPGWMAPIARLSRGSRPTRRRRTIAKIRRHRITRLGSRALLAHLWRRPRNFDQYGGCREGAAPKCGSDTGR
jgi:integrase